MTQRNYADIQRGVDPYADADATQSHLTALGKVYIPFNMPAALLDAGTSIELVSPVKGQITALRTTVQTAGTTGGAITVEVNTVVVVGLSVTIGDADAAGTRQVDEIAATVPTGAVEPGDRIEIIPASAFNSSGPLNAVLEITV